MTNHVATFQPLNDSERELIRRSRKSVDFLRRYGKWFAAIGFFRAASWIGMGTLVLYVAIRVSGNPQGFLGGVGIGIGIGAIVGTMTMQGLDGFIRAMSIMRGLPETKLLVKLHDALASINNVDAQSPEPHGPIIF